MIIIHDFFNIFYFFIFLFFYFLFQVQISVKSFHQVAFFKSIFQQSQVSIQDLKFHIEHFISHELERKKIIKESEENEPVLRTQSKRNSEQNIDSLLGNWMVKMWLLCMEWGKKGAEPRGAYRKMRGVFGELMERVVGRVDWFFWDLILVYGRLESISALTLLGLKTRWFLLYMNCYFPFELSGKNVAVLSTRNHGLYSENRKYYQCECPWRLLYRGFGGWSVSEPPLQRNTHNKGSAGQ